MSEHKFKTKINLAYAAIIIPLICWFGLVGFLIGEIIEFYHGICWLLGYPILLGACLAFIVLLWWLDKSCNNEGFRRFVRRNTRYY